MTDYYVATTGNDSNPGTQSQPWLTISHAASVVTTAGSVVHVASGTYAEQVTFTHGGITGSPITFVSTTKWGAHISLADSTHYYVVAIGCANFVFSGFDVSGPHQHYGIDFIAGAGPNASAIHNNVHDVGSISPQDPGGPDGTGGAFGAGNQNTTGPIIIDSNWIHDCGWDTGNHASYLTTPFNSYGGGTFSNNIVQNITGSMVHLLGYAVPPSSNTYGNVSGWDIINNTSINCSYGVLFDGADASAPDPGTSTDHIRVFNNIFVDSVYFGVYGGTHGTWDPLTILVWNNLEYNSIFAIGNNDPGIWVENDAYTQRNNLLATSPQFISYDNSTHTGDFHLQGTSPAINAGINSIHLAFDYDGVVRPSNESIDIGAYEYVTIPTAFFPPMTRRGS